MRTIEIADVELAQKAWGASLIALGRVYQEGGDYRARGRELIGALYGYHVGPVLFTPTLAEHDQFRNSADGALSYFVGGNPDFAEDHGFALRLWTAVMFENSGVICLSDSALAMGNYFFTDTQGSEVKVEYSFSYFRGPDGDVLIQLHHSSLPYSSS